MSVPREERARLRRDAIARRDALPPALRARWSRHIGRRLAALPEFRRAAAVMLYASFRSEVDTAPLVAAALRARKRVLLPRTVPETRTLEPREVYAGGRRGPAEVLAPGAYGIPEPPSDAPLLDPGCLDLVVVPGACFDELGGRLGYGAGYYDRFLPRAGRAAAVGLAFEAQVVARVPAAAHDVTLDAVVTERRVIRPRQQAAPRGERTMGRDDGAG